MQKDLYIIKLGGSVITDKSAGDFIMRENLMREIVRNITESHDAHTQQLLIIHGGGSASHAIAKEHALKTGSHGDIVKEEACAKIQKNIHHLQDTLVHALSDAGLSAHIFRSQDLYANTNGTLTGIRDTVLTNALTRGIIPVISGAVIPDTVWGHSILSGDTLCAHYAQALQAHTVALASDIDGVFTDNPHIHPNAQLLSTISLHDIIGDTSDYMIGAAHTTDITGGLSGKLHAFIPLLDSVHKPQNLFIFNGTCPKNFTQLLKNQLKIKTTVTFL